MTKRTAFKFAVLMTLALAISAPAFAQSNPADPLNMIGADPEAKKKDYDAFWATVKKEDAAMRDQVLALSQTDPAEARRMAEEYDAQRKAKVAAYMRQYYGMSGSAR
jgi:hypothetical protein